MIDFMVDLITWFFSGIYDFVVQMYSYVIIRVEAFKWWWARESLIFAWDVGRQILVDLNISSKLNNALSELDAETIAWLSVFRVFEAINIILNAIATRFAMARLGF